MDLPRINYAQADARDATVIDKVRRGVLEHLIRPKEFPRIFQLFRWLGSALLPDLLPQTLTYLEALVLDIALRAEVGLREASGRGHHE